MPLINILNISFKSFNSQVLLKFFLNHRVQTHLSLFLTEIYQIVPMEKKMLEKLFAKKYYLYSNIKADVKMLLKVIFTEIYNK